MFDVGRTRCRWASARLVVAGALLSGFLLACGASQPVEVAVSGLPPAPPVPAPPAPTTIFQGTVASVDPATGIVAVDVHIVWAPAIQGGAHQRRVLVDRATRWDPAPAALSDRLVGADVQVEALDAVEGVWPALKVQLVDID